MNSVLNNIQFFSIANTTATRSNKHAYVCSHTKEALRV